MLFINYLTEFNLPQTIISSELLQSNALEMAGIQLLNYVHRTLLTSPVNNLAVQFVQNAKLALKIK